MTKSLNVDNVIYFLENFGKKILRSISNYETFLYIKNPKKISENVFGYYTSTIQLAKYYDPTKKYDEFAVEKLNTYSKINFYNSLVVYGNLNVAKINSLRGISLVFPLKEEYFFLMNTADFSGKIIGKNLAKELEDVDSKESFNDLIAIEELKIFKKPGTFLMKARRNPREEALLYARHIIVIPFDRIEKNLEFKNWLEQNVTKSLPNI